MREAGGQLEKGIAMVDAGEKEAAASVFETALKMMPADRMGVIILAIQKLNSRQLWMVSAKFSQKLDKNPDDPPLRLASQEALFHVAGEKDGEGLARWMVDRIPRWAIARDRWAAGWRSIPENPRTANRSSGPGWNWRGGRKNRSCARLWANTCASPETRRRGIPRQGSLDGVHHTPLVKGRTREDDRKMATEVKRVPCMAANWKMNKNSAEAATSSARYSRSSKRSAAWNG